MRRPSAALYRVPGHRRCFRFRPPNAIFAAITLAAAISGPSVLQAHSWYPAQCCTGQDCKKVDQLDYLPDGSILMHFGGQQVVVPRGFSMQPSQDLEAHVCVFRGSNGRWMPRCVFLPGTALAPGRRLVNG